MKAKKMLKNQMLIILMIAVAGILTPAYAAESVTDDVLLNSLPADCLFCLRVNNINQSLALLDQYLAGASPLPMPLAMLVNFQLGTIIGDPLLTGLDMGGDFGVFAIAPPTDQADPLLGILVPMENYKEFISSNKNCTPAENGLTLLTTPEAPQQRFLLAPAGDKHALVVSETQKAALAPLQKALSANSPLLNRLSAAQSKTAVSAPAWVYVNFATLYEKYNKEIMGMMQAAQMESTTQAPPGMEDMVTMYLKMVTAFFNEFAGQADSMTLALYPEPTLLSIDTAFRAKDGSDISKMLTTGTNTSSYSLAGYLDNNNAINGLMKMDSPCLQQLYDMMFDIMGESVEDPEFKEKTDNMKALTQKAFDAMGDEMSFSFDYTSGQPPFKMQEVIEVKDIPAMKAMMAESMESANVFYEGMGLPAKLEYQPGASTYKNATIDVFKLSIIQTEGTDEAMQQQLASLYGDGFKYYAATTSDKYIVTMGAEGEQILKALIDKPTTAAASGDIKIALDTLKNTPYQDMVCSVNVIKLLKGLGQMMQSLPNPGTGLPIDIGEITSKLNIESQSTMVLGAQVGDGQASMRLALPKQHLIEIIAMGMQIQAQMTPQQETFQPIDPAAE